MSGLSVSRQANGIQASRADMIISVSDVHNAQFYHKRVTTSVLWIVGALLINKDQYFISCILLPLLDIDVSPCENDVNCRF